MFRKLHQAYRQLQFYRKALNSKGHGTHSPFVYTFITEVLNDDRHYYAYDEIKYLKKELLSDKTKILYNQKETTVGELTQNGQSDKYNRLLFRIVAYYNPRNILEIGCTSGITTSFLASPNKSIPVYSIATSELMASAAINNIKPLALENVIITSLEEIDKLKEIITQPFDLIFINQAIGDISQFLQLTSLIKEDAIVIFKDINKDLEIVKSWNMLKSVESTTISVDLFSIGIVFFKREQLKKQLFAIRF